MRDEVGGGEHLSADRLEADLGAQQSGGHTFDNTPLPDGVSSNPFAWPANERPLMWIAAEKVDRVFPHQDAEVVLRFGQQSVRVDELVAIGGLQRVPLVDVAVHEDGSFVVVRCDPTGCTRTRMLDRSLRARTIQFLPRGDDRVDEPLALVGTCRETDVGAVANPRRSGREDFHPLIERKSEVVQRRSEPFDEQCAPFFVRSQQPCASVAVGQSKDGDLVPCCIALAWHDQLHDCDANRRSVDLGNECFGCILEDPSDTKVPVTFDALDQQRQVDKPSVGAGGDRLVTNDDRELYHR